ncbi:hypothetical protein PoB_006387500 [Plakobranchus ocellatus]|uniref:Uncharacterized protein n=1 Tax=Plakobranchus ocellatus TaxID=259542 RepID=A0AAV4CZY9_9GAST|nr:hypothetical protein PoB_006387500 [Plakobranchus ocellatus]
MTRTPSEMTETSQHQIPPTANIQRESERKRLNKNVEAWEGIKSHRPTMCQSRCHHRNTPQHTLLNCVISFTARLRSSPQQMLLSAPHWPRDISEK